MKLSVILKDNNATVDEVWNACTKTSVLNNVVRKNGGIKTKRMLSDNGFFCQGSLNVRGENLQRNWWQNLWVWHFQMLEIQKNIEDFLVWNIIENHYESEDENPPHHSETGKIKYLQKTLNSMNDFLLLILMSYVGSCFKLLRMHWYRSMKPFRTNLKLVIKKHLCTFYNSCPGVKFSSNCVMLNGMSKYICS